MYKIKFTAIGLSFALLNVAVQPAYAEVNLSTQSGQASVLASAVPIVSVWIITQGTRASLKGVTGSVPVAKTAEQQPKWKITHLEQHNSGVRAQLESNDGTQTLDVVLPETVVRDAQLSPNDTVTMRKMGKSSAVLSHGDKPFAVLADPGGNLVHSSKK